MSNLTIGSLTTMHRRPEVLLITEAAEPEPFELARAWRNGYMQAVRNCATDIAGLAAQLERLATQIEIQG